MPKLDLDLTNLNRSRLQLAETQAALRLAEQAVAEAEAAQRQAYRNGASGEQLDAATARVTMAKAEARAQNNQRHRLIDSIRLASDDLLLQRDPARMIDALDGSHPVLMLPVRLETKFTDDRQHLRIRIYPDIAHLQQHEPRLQLKEIAAGQAYWISRFQSDDNATAAWATLTDAYRPPRAKWIVEQTTPQNLAAMGSTIDGELATPMFAEIASRPDGGGKEAYAVALPDRFVAVGLKNGQEVFRVWGLAVPERLPLSFDFQYLDENDPDVFGGDRAWLADYNAARDLGMGITVGPQHLRHNFNWLQGLDRLLVLGVDWTQTPESAAAAFGDLLNAHQNSHGLQFVSPGTPTNQTAAVRSGYQPFDPAFAASLDPARAGEPPSAQSAGARLQQALGLDGASFDLTGISGAGLREDELAQHMQNALWRATLGYSLDYFWNPVNAENSLISDEAIAKLRNFVLRYLRPGGAYPALRIGRQPYGILPICPPGAWEADATSQVEIKLTALTQALRFHWQNALDNPDPGKRPPRIDKPDGDTLKEVLGSLPWSRDKQFRRVAGESVTDKTPDLLKHQRVQNILFGSIKASLFQTLGLPAKTNPYFGTLTQDPKPHSLGSVPWVQGDERQPHLDKPDEAILEPNYIAKLVALITQPGDNIRAPLVAMQDGDSLLEALLAMAADEELLKSGEALFYSHMRRSGYASNLAKLKIGVRETLAIDSALKVGDTIDVDSPQMLLNLKLNGSTAGKTLGAHLAERLRLNLSSDETANLVALQDSLAFLQHRTVGELRRALAGTLDAYGYRLDAWITSLAQRRLAHLRQRENSRHGLHLGAYAFVENLRPDDPNNPRHADSLGYTHAPSVPQAVAAAILRSGHVANREAAASAFNIDLRSRRVKRAQRLLEGMDNGQSLAALLGYRFERALRDQTPTMAVYTRAFRQHYPLRKAGEKPGDQPQEAIAARDVVDGIGLLEASRKLGGYKLPDGFDPAMPSADFEKLRLIIADLEDLFDGVADVLVAESVYQVTQGNLERAGAALAVLDKQDRGLEPRVTATSRSGRGYTQRVVTLSPGDDAGPWQAVSNNDPRARAEPRLNAWLAAMLGDPARYRLRATYTGVADAESHRDIDLLELALSPLSLVLLSQPDQAHAQGLLQTKLARLFSLNPPANATGLIIESAGPPGFLGLAELEAHAYLLRRLITQARPLRRTDLVLVDDDKETGELDEQGEYLGIDEVELAGRAASALQQLTSVRDAVKAAFEALPKPLPAPETPNYFTLLNAVASALALAAELASPDALPTQDDTAASLADWRARTERVLADLETRLTRASLPLPPEENTFPRRVDRAIAQIKAVFGKDFPVLPQFTLGVYATEFEAVLNDRNTLLAGDTLAPSGWLSKLGHVREGAARLSQALSASQALGVPPAAGDYQVLQFPRPASNLVNSAVWAALTKPDPKNRVQVALLAHAPNFAPPQAGTALAGLFVDEWAEFIPAPEQNTGLSFHFDAPGARAPQSMLLAVPPRLTMEHWDFDLLLACVNEAFDLAKIRAVRPKDLEGGLGLLLPQVFLPDNYSKDVPAVPLLKLIGKYLPAHVSEAVYQAMGAIPLGKL